MDSKLYWIQFNKVRTMNKVKLLLNPELAKHFRFPVSRKRSALWFFNNEIRNDLIEPPLGSANQVPPKKVKRNRILQMWRNMEPESKRKYFNMAELDEVRYKEQKSLWVSQVGALLQKYQDINRAMEMAPSHQELQSEFLESLEKLQRKLEQMIQTESTKELYKDAIKKSTPGSLTAEEISTFMPPHHEAILTKPRKPPSTYALFFLDNKARYHKIRRETRTKDASMRLCANEWANLDSDTKQAYEDRYQKLKEEYYKALEQYRAEIEETSESYLQEAFREKKNFRRSLRKRLRDSSMLPLSIRNPFNFFMMEHKDSILTDATETWRNLPLEEKKKYIKMTEEDVKRYNREIEAYNEIKQSLEEMITKKKISQPAK